MPGRMFLVDTEQGRIIDDEEVKADIVRRKPYRSWVTEHRISWTNCPIRSMYRSPTIPRSGSVNRRSATIEELKMVITPMVVEGGKPFRRWARIRRSRCCPTGRNCSSNTSKLFAGHESADRSDPRRARDVAPTTSIGPKPNLMDEHPESPAASG